jgi:cold shock CspA family protein
MARGKMLWFNDRKNLGFIRTEEGERLEVLGTGFARGQRPKGKCAESAVSFEIDESGEERRAENVTFVDDEAPRRARLRTRGIRTR